MTLTKTDVKKAISEKVDPFIEQVDKKFEQVDKRFEQVDKRFEQVDKRFESLENKLDDKFNQILTGQDMIMRELQEMRDEHTMLHYRVHDVHQPMLENHEKRLTTLEV